MAAFAYSVAGEISDESEGECGTVPCSPSIPRFGTPSLEERAQIVTDGRSFFESFFKQKEPPSNIADSPCHQAQGESPGQSSLCEEESGEKGESPGSEEKRKAQFSFAGRYKPKTPQRIFFWENAIKAFHDFHDRFPKRPRMSQTSFWDLFKAEYKKAAGDSLDAKLEATIEQFDDKYGQKRPRKGK